MRSRGQCITIAAGVGVLGTFSFLLSLGMVISAETFGFRAGGAAFAVCFGVMLFGGFRSAFCGIRRCGSAVEIRNPLSNVRVEIADIEAVGRGSWSLLPKVGLLYLRDGTTQHIWGIQAPNVFESHTDRLLAQVADELGVEYRPRRVRSSTWTPNRNG